MSVQVDMEQRIELAISSMVKMIEHQQAAIFHCLQTGLIGPALILIYTTIDIMASLDIHSDRDVKSSDFKAWVKEYLLPNSNLTASAEDLWGARCGLVHSYSLQSRKTQTQKAVVVFYAFGDADETEAQDKLDKTGQPVRVIHISKLFKALVDGIASFVSKARQNSDKAITVTWRAQRLMLLKLTTDVDGLLDGMPN